MLVEWRTLYEAQKTEQLEANQKDQSFEEVAAAVVHQ